MTDRRSTSNKEEFAVAANNEFQLTTEQRDAVVCLALRGEFDLAAAERFERELHRAEFDGARQIVIDLRGLSFIDSTGLQMVLKADARARENGFDLTVVRGPENVQRVFQVTGMEEYLPMVDDRPQDA